MDRSNKGNSKKVERNEKFTRDKYIRNGNLFSDEDKDLVDIGFKLMVEFSPLIYRHIFR